MLPNGIYSVDNALHMWMMVFRMNEQFKLKISPRMELKKKKLGNFSWVMNSYNTWQSNH